MSPLGGAGGGAGVTGREGPAWAEIRRLADAVFRSAGGVDFGELAPGAGAGDVPFHAAWVAVGPGETGRRHRHHEAERWIIVEGRGELSSQGRTCEVGPGDVVELPPFVDHALHNPSPERRVVFFSLWWHDAALASRLAGAEAAPPPRRRAIVTATPPTPNGDLHLGHFAGPYAAADAHARYLRMKGVEAYYVTGSDDFQSYVAGQALRAGGSPGDVANHYAGRIEGALRAGGVRCDQFVRSMEPDYVARVQRMVRALYEAGQIVARECEYLVSPHDGRRLFEFYVGGACSHCRAPAGGGVCEECGRPNEGARLVDPVATLGSGSGLGRAAPGAGGGLGRATVARLVLPLARHADRVRALLDRVAMPTRLRALAEAMLDEGAPDVPVTHPHEWGVPCAIEGFEGQVVSSWFEMGHSMLEGARRAGERAGWARPGGPTRAPAGAELVQFFGFDNAFYYTLLYPLLASLVDPASEPPAAFVCNEFYLLEGSKFSTSRGHAVWLAEALAEGPADPLRFYLAYTRPEADRTDFTRGEYGAFVARELRGAWLGWLRELGGRLDEFAGGEAPEPGSWTDAQRRHYAELGRVTARVREGYEAASFSLQGASRGLIELVRVASAFARGERHWAGLASRRDERRTALALELAAARALAQHVAPLMPDFARRLWAALGLGGDVEALGFDDHVAWVPPGSRVVLGGEALGEPFGPA